MDCKVYYHVSSPTIFMIHCEIIRKNAVITLSFPDKTDTCKKVYLI